MHIGTTKRPVSVITRSVILSFLTRMYRRQLQVIRITYPRRHDVIAWLTAIADGSSSYQYTSGHGRMTRTRKWRAGSAAAAACVAGQPWALWVGRPALRGAAAN